VVTVITNNSHYEYPRGCKIDVSGNGELVILDVNQNIIAAYALGSWDRAYVETVLSMKTREELEGFGGSQ
jgi:hypothetical protein